MDMIFEDKDLGFGFCYRLVDNYTAPMVDEFDNPYGQGGVYLRVEKFSITKKTPCGVRILFENGTKFINLNKVKQFASPTIEEAKKHFLARKKRQLSIYQARINDVERAIHEFEQGHIIL